MVQVINHMSLLILIILQIKSKMKGRERQQLHSYNNGGKSGICTPTDEWATLSNPSRGADVIDSDLVPSCVD